MSRQRLKTEKELEDFIQNHLSDIELPVSSDSDTENDIVVPKNAIPYPDLTDCVIAPNADEDNRDGEDEIIKEPLNLEDNNIEYVDEFKTYNITEKSDIAFRRREYQPNFSVANENLFKLLGSEDFIEKSAFQYFSAYFPNEMFERMATYTNIYAMQPNNYKGSFRNTNHLEMMKFVGIHIMMGCLKFPQIKMYWCNDLRIECVAHVMSIERFYQLRQTFHVVDNLKIPNDCNDKFFKIRPIINSVLKRCREIPVEEIVAVDEQIIPFSGHLSVKQYMRGKPNPWGIKVYILCGKSGYPYDFFMYQGKNSELSVFELARFGFGAATVLHLAKRITTPGHQLFCDNFFSTFNLFEILRDRGIKATGKTLSL